jgi:hypothetical protein
VIEQHRFIPDDVREAFEDAIAAFQNWQYGETEPRVFCNKQFVSFDNICNLTAVFSGDASDQAYYTVTVLAAECREGPEHLNHDCRGPAHRGYSQVALCLLRLVHARRNYFKRREQQLKARGS